MSNVKHFSSRTGALMHLDDNPEVEGEPVHLRSVLDYNGWAVSQIWGIFLASGTYLSDEEVEYDTQEHALQGSISQGRHAPHR